MLDPDEQIGSTRHFLRELNRFGLTSAIDAGGGFQSFPENYAAVAALAAQGDLSVRIAYHLFPQVPGQELHDLQRFTEMAKPGQGDEWLRINGAGENLTWSSADYENFTEPRPELEVRAASELEAAVRLLLDHGWGFRLHASYGETIEKDLDVFATIARDGGFPRGVPWFFDHAETVSEVSLDRIAEYGGAISIQNRMMFQGRAFVDRYGADAARHAPPLARMRERGLTVAAGTDATRVASYNPWLSLAWLVGGRDIAGRPLAAPENRLDRATALAMYTTAGAQLTGEGDVKGVLREGFYADLAVLSDDYFTVAEEDISHIESVLTVVGGRVAYAAGPFEGVAPPPPEIVPAWSPVAAFGGFCATPQPNGANQALAVGDIVAASAEYQTWRARRGEAVAVRPETDDPCLGL